MDTHNTALTILQCAIACNTVGQFDELEWNTLSTKPNIFDSVTRNENLLAVVLFYRKGVEV